MPVGTPLESVPQGSIVRVGDEFVYEYDTSSRQKRDWIVLEPSERKLLYRQPHTQESYFWGFNHEFNPNSTAGNGNSLAKYLANSFLPSMGTAANWVETHTWDTRAVDGTRIYPDVSAKLGLLTAAEWEMYRTDPDINLGYVYSYYLMTPVSYTSELDGANRVGVSYVSSGALTYTKDYLSGDGITVLDSFVSVNASVRPVAYLKTGLYVYGGAGTAADPYIIGEGAPTGVSAVSVTAVDSTTATPSNYTFRFTTSASGALAAGTDKIYITLPSGFVAASSGTATFGDESTASYTTAGSTMTIDAPTAAGNASLEVTLELVSPSAMGAYSFELRTSKDIVNGSAEFTVTGSSDATLHSVTVSDGAIRTIGGVDYLYVDERRSSVSVTATATHPRAQVSVAGGETAQQTKTELVFLTGSTFDISVTPENGDSPTVKTIVIRKTKRPDSSIGTMAPGSIVRFGGQDWIAVEPTTQTFLFKGAYGSDRDWGNGVLGAASEAEFPSLRFDPAVPGSLAQALNTTFLQSLDTGMKESQWVVPTTSEVHPLWIADGGISEIASSDIPVPDTYLASGKVLLPTYEQYLAWGTAGTIQEQHDYTGWNYDWYLLNPMAAAETSDFSFAYVNDEGPVLEDGTTHYVRPVVRLQNNLLISGGDGSAESPYTLELDTTYAFDETLDVFREDTTAGAATGMTVSFKPIRGLAADDAIIMQFPAEFHTADIPVTGALEVRVDGEAAEEVAYTHNAGVVTLLLPEDVSYGQTVEIEFLPTAGIRNAGVSTIYDFYISIPSITDYPSGYTLLVDGAADLIIEGQPSDEGDFLAGQTKMYEMYVTNVGNLPTDGEVTVTVSASYFETVTLTGDGWECVDLACSRNDPLAAEGVYPPLIAVIEVPTELAYGTGFLSAYVSGGNDGVNENNSMSTFQPALYELPYIDVDPVNDGYWTNWAEATITVERPLYGRPLDPTSFRYAWSTTSTMPETGWLPFSNGETITKSDEGVWYLHIVAGDDHGNEIYVQPNAYKIDLTEPLLSVSFLSDGTGYSPGTWTRGPVKATVSATDENGFVSFETSEDGGESWSEGDMIELSAEGMHGIMFRATDEAGNSAYSPWYEVKIDRTGPVLTVELRTADEVPYTSGDIAEQTVYLHNMSSWDNNGQATMHFFSLNGGAWKGIDELTPFASNGEYHVTFRAVDSLGNASTQTFIIRVEAPAPQLTLSRSPDGVTNGDVEVAIDAGDATEVKWSAGAQDASYFAEGGGTPLTHDTDGKYRFAVSENGTYTVYAANASGLHALATIEVDDIFKIAPTATLELSTTAPTNGNVTIHGVGEAAGAGNGLVEARWAYGMLTAEQFEEDPSLGTPLFIVDNSFAFEATENGSYTVYVRDLAGNASVQTTEVANIERRPPALTLHAGPATNQVTVTVAANVYGTGNALTALKWEAGTVAAEHFSVAGTSIALDAPSFQATANGVYTVYAKDLAGNETVAHLTIDSILTTAPAIALTPSTEDVTNGGVEVAVDAGNATLVKWAVGVQEASYFVDGGGTPLTKDADGKYRFGVSANGTYTVFAANAAGLRSTAAIAIGNIVTDGPAATFELSTTALTNGSVTVHGVGHAAGSGNGLSELRWTFGGEWTVAHFADPAFGEPLPHETGAFSFAATENGVYTVYLADLAGNSSIERVTVANIERRAPQLTLLYPNEPTNHSVTISVSDTVYGIDIGNALETLKWDYGVRTAGHFATAGSAIDLTTRAFEVGANDDYTVYARDQAGNETVAYATIANIYATAPTITIARTPDAPTTGNVTVSVTISVYGANNGIQSVQWIAGDQATSLSAVAEQQIEVSENGIYTIVVTDLAGNTMSQTVGIGNIYRTPPVLTAVMTPESPTYGAVTVIVSATAVGSGNGIDAVLWAPGERTLAEFPTVGQAVYGGFFQVTANGKYTLYARDLAGNSAVRIVDVSQIKPIPTDGLPKIAFIAVDEGGASVSVVFDRPLDRGQPLSASDFSLSGVNGSIASVAYAPSDARAVIIEIASSETTLVWQPTASLSAAIGAVRSEAGIVNAAIANAAVVTPAKRNALTDAINPPESGERLALGKIIAYLLAGGNVDVNLDGATDKSDIEFLLQLIEPRALTGSEGV